MANISPATAHTPSKSEKMKRTKARATAGATEWWEHEATKSKGAKLCQRCGAVYMDGHWHTAPKLSEEMKLRKARAGAEETLCMQCKWIIHGRDLSKSGFEGIVTLDGLTDAAEKAEILATVRNFANRAVKRDPEDQVIAIDDRGERVVITTTENQLAAGIGKAVDASHKGGKLTITWSEKDLPARIHWKRKP